jgi:tetratricopeptide (TPR) repeat protein
MQEPAQEYEIPVEPQAEPVQEYEIPIEPVAAPAQEYEIPIEPVAVTDPEEEYVIDEAPADDTETEPDKGVTTVDDDLSDILEEEDAANEVGTDNTRDLASEITSDVEENDFRSHYDLGMAYIEMALYTESIKELQISSRSEQLQLRSLEMIGHCFLLLENPRLAVKQLNRGLEIAMNTGGDNLGIHYNLGLAYEALEEPDKAREHFEEVYIVDVTFREISNKMKKYSTVS